MKTTRLLLTLWLLAFLLALPGVPNGQAQSPTFTGSQPAVTLLNDGLHLEWRLPSPQLVNTTTGDLEIQLPGFSVENKPGAARLPWVSFLVALPQQATPVLEVQTGQTERLGLDKPLAANAGEASTYDARTATNKIPLRFDEIGTVRGIRLARVLFRPAWMEGGQLAFTPNLSATIRFQTPVHPMAVQDSLAQMVQSIVINPSQVETSLSTTSAARLSTAPNALAAADTNAVIEVAKVGIYQVTYEQLAAAGFAVSTVNPGNLQLSHAGVAVPFEWVSLASNTSFPPGGALRFFARPTFSRWANNDTYLLSAGTTPGLRMTSRAAVPPGATPGSAWANPMFEENQIYTPDCGCAGIPAGRDGDRWVWTHLDQPSKPTDWFQLVTPNVDPGQPASITLWWIGKTADLTNPTHQVNVSLNGITLGVVSWQGQIAYQATLAIPAGVLVSGGSNIISFSLTALSGVVTNGVWLDAMQVHYRLGSEVMSAPVEFTGGDQAAHTYTLQLDSVAGLVAYDVSNPLAPVKLDGVPVNANSLTIGNPSASAAPVFWVANGSTILTPAAVRLQRTLLTANQTGADEVILLADGYESALASLASLRTSQGLKVVTENLQAIYDQFSFGRMDPDAIRSYLKMTYQNWAVKPRYVLLVGDGTVDPKQYRNDSSKTIAPALLASVDPFLVESAADNRYVTLDSASALLPSMMIGRLPANSPAEAAAMVNKIVQYETNPVPGLWHGQTVFVADSVDSGGDFPSISNTDAAIIPGPYFAPKKLYNLVNIADPTQMHTQIVSAWNQGASVIVFNGHASPVFWAMKTNPDPINTNYFSVLHVNQLNELTNGQKLPVVLDMTCFTGSFQTASLQTLDESLVRKPDGGAVAAWGSTSLGISTGDEYLAQGFLTSLVGGPNSGRLGEATLTGKLMLAAKDPQNQYLIDTFTLFGDPAGRIKLNLVPDHSLMMPYVIR